MAKPYTFYSYREANTEAKKLRKKGFDVRVVIGDATGKFFSILRNTSYPDDLKLVRRKK